MQHHFIHEALDYKAISAGSDFQSWLESGTFEIIAEMIYRAYTDFSDRRLFTEGIQFSENGNSNGFIFRHPQFSYQDLSFFQLVIVHKLKELSYIVNLAEKKSIPQNKLNALPNLVYYLKPSVRLSLGKEKSLQLYGNVHIECMSEGQEVVRLRFICHSYRDSNYEAALPFGDLMEILFRKSDN